MDLRRVQEMGGGTSLISLPKDWARRNKLGRGSVVSIERRPDNALVIYPFAVDEKAGRDVEIRYPAEYTDYLINEVTGAYLLGYDTIRILGRERISLEHREVIKKVVRQLIGLEIMEEDSRSMSIQFLLQPSTLEPEKMLRRMHLITLGMHGDALTSFVEGDASLARIAMGRDDEVDRLYFLLVRMIRSSVLDTGLAARFGLTAIECLDYRVVANIVEAIGDYSVEMAEASAEATQELGEIRDEYRSLVGMLRDSQEMAIRAFLARSAKDARQVVGIHRTVTSRLDGIVSSLNRSEARLKSAFTVIEGVDKVSRSCVDIADLAVTMYPTVK